MYHNIILSAIFLSLLLRPPIAVGEPMEFRINNIKLVFDVPHWRMTKLSRSTRANDVDLESMEPNEPTSSITLYQDYWTFWKFPWRKQGMLFFRATVVRYPSVDKPFMCIGDILNYLLRPDSDVREKMSAGQRVFINFGGAEWLRSTHEDKTLYRTALSGDAVLILSFSAPPHRGGADHTRARSDEIKKSILDSIYLTNAPFEKPCAKK